jgi:hypothetical protein
MKRMTLELKALSGLVSRPMPNNFFTKDFLSMKNGLIPLGSTYGCRGKRGLCDYSLRKQDCWILFSSRGKVLKSQVN